MNADFTGRTVPAEILARLVELKDGPRDEHYRSSKEAAWEAARAALAAASPPEVEAGSGERRRWELTVYDDQGRAGQVFAGASCPATDEQIWAAVRVLDPASPPASSAPSGPADEVIERAARHARDMFRAWTNTYDHDGYDAWRDVARTVLAEAQSAPQATETAEVLRGLVEAITKLAAEYQDHAMRREVAGVRMAQRFVEAALRRVEGEQPSGKRIHCVDCLLELVSFHNGHWRDASGSYQCDGEVVRTGRKYHVPPPAPDTGQLDPERGGEK